MTVTTRPATTRHGLVPTLIAALLLTLGLGACGPKAVHEEDLPAVGKAWAAFTGARTASRETTSGFSASGSLNYAGPDRSTRVVLEFWGNPGHTMRMDMSTGFGTPVALWRENGTGIEGYFPLEHALYLHADPRAGAARMGLGIPLSLTDLASLISGTYEGLVPGRYASGAAEQDGGFTYKFSDQGPVSSLTLDATGRPVVFAGRLHGIDWTLTAGNYEEATELPEPRRFELKMDNGVFAVIRVKRLERRAAPWPEKKLALAVPDGTKTVHLEMFENLDQ